ncbi:phospholipase-like protein [Tanacetum coccineum]
MDGINIDDLSIKQYLRLTQKTRHLACYFNAVQSNNEFDYDSKDMELDEEADYINDEESAEMEKHMKMQKDKSEEDALIAIIKSIREEVKAVIEKKQSNTSEADKIKEVSSMASDDTMEDDADLDARVNVMPKSIYEYLDMDNLRNANILDKAADTTYQEPLGTVENILVKIDKFEFPCDFVVTNMTNELGDTIILGRAFLESTRAQIDVFKEEISLGISEDKVKFDMNRNYYQSDITIKRVYMASVGQEEESFNLVEIGQDLFLGLIKRWHIRKPVKIFYDDGTGEDCGMWPTCDPNSNFCYGYEEVFGRDEHGTLRQYVCFRDHERRTVKRSCMGFANFLQVYYGHQRIGDTTRQRRYYEWVAQNYEFDNNRSPSTTIVSDKYPYNIDYPIPIPSGE